MSDSHEFPEYTDAAGVKWTADFWVRQTRPLLCVCDEPGGQLGYAYVEAEEALAKLLKRLPPAADRLDIIRRIRDDVQAWREVAAHG